jgi:hypothetical protein
MMFAGTIQKPSLVFPRNAFLASHLLILKLAEWSLLIALVLGNSRLKENQLV